MTSDFTMETMEAESDWPDQESQLLRTPRGKINRIRKIKNILLRTVIVVAVIVIIVVIVGLAMRNKEEGRTEISVTDWLQTQCANKGASPSCPWKRGANPVLVVALGGFRADYVAREITPVINKLRNCGVQTPYLRPVYPTKSYPNQFTIVTGLYPESHGIVNDNMFDPGMKAMFNRTKSNPDWWGGEPIWVTAKKQGKKTASCNWAGSDVIQPELRCNGSESTEGMIDMAIGWLMMEGSKRPDLITLYLNELDSKGRDTGPDSPETYVSIKTIDDAIGKLMTGLYKHNIDNCVNVILLSDHGMSDTSCLRRIGLDYYMEETPEWKNVPKFAGTSGSIYTSFTQQGTTVVENTDDLGIAERIIDSVSCMSSHLKVYTGGTIPLRHHYSNSDRIGNIVLDVEDRWLVQPEESEACPKGSYGYDETYSSMHALFLAHGPDLQHNVTTEPFESIELYNLMVDLLKIKAALNNGTVGTLSHILRKAPTITHQDGMTVSVCTGNRVRQSTCKCESEVDYKLPDSLKMNTFPFGQPVHQGDVNACILFGRQFTVIFSSDNKQPLLSSYQLTANQAQNHKTVNSTCSMPDKRLTDSVNPDCNEYRSVNNNIEAVHLFDPGFSTTEDEITESYLSSNLVPMYSEFRGGIWALLWSLVKEYAVISNRIHVTLGPIFDRNHDGKADGPNNDSTKNVGNHSTVPIPTHFYMIITKCSKQNTDVINCRPEDLDILSFVLPHVKKNSNCESDAAYLRTYMVRIRDIELLTGLRLLTKFETNIGARKRTFLPPDIWPSSLLAHWADMPCDQSNVCNSDYKPLLLISFDGFRADYLNRKLTPTLEKLRNCGVRTPYMRSVYPTESYPNHHTIITGLYPESHGIVENRMYDSKMNATFDEDTEQDSRWWKGEPIWVTAKRQGKRSASIQWFGENVDDPAKQPSITSNLGNDESDTFGDAVDQVIRWMSMDDQERPDFISLYIWQPDEQGHEFGPDSHQLNDMLKYMDSLIQQLMDGLFRNNLHSCVNLVIVSDHGMAEESCSKQVALKPLYPGIENLVSYLGTTGIINTHYRREGSVVLPNENAPRGEDVLHALECKSEHLEVFTKETLPVRYHYTNNERIGNVMMDATNDWMIRNEKAEICNGKGNHGYDPAYKSMRAIFLAHGPAFKQNFEAEPFENIELYNLMSGIIGLNAAPNNGTFGSLDYILRETPEDEDRTRLLDIEPCVGTYENRTSTCSCNRKNSEIPSGKHTFHGGLALEDPRLSICSLTNSLFATVYSKDNKQPAMISFLITPKQVNINPLSTVTCVVPDTKLTTDDNPDCDFYTNTDENLTRVHLFDPGLAVTPLEMEQTQLSSNLVTMHSGFHTHIWDPAMTMISHFAVRFKFVHVSFGPIFDRNFDGLADGPSISQLYVKNGSTVPVPSHYFIILLKCHDEHIEPDKCPTENIDILSFVLPHVGAIPNCKTFSSFLLKNVARIRDIELLTGLRFFTAAEWTLAARKRTHLPTELWSFD